MRHAIGLTGAIIVGAATQAEVVTQSASMVPVAGGSDACHDGNGTRQNSFLRSFNLPSFGIELLCRGQCRDRRAVR